MDAHRMDLILVGQAATTWFMTGLIWFVQLVHYPLMSNVGSESFARYHLEHRRRTTWVVGPPMLIEGVTAVALVFRPPGAVPPWQVWLALGLVATIWLSTATLQVPRHTRLTDRFEVAAHRGLVAGNWIRVVAWSARSVLLLHWLSLSAS